MMRFDVAIKTCMKKYVTFSGRAQRSEYWWFMLFNLLATVANAGLDSMLFDTRPEETGPLSALYSILILLPLLSVTARRLHDMDKSAWWMVAPYGVLFFAAISAAFELNIFAAVGGIAALVLLVVLFVWTVMRGTEGPNRFGPDPLQPKATWTSSIPTVDRDD